MQSPKDDGTGIIFLNPTTMNKKDKNENELMDVFNMLNDLAGKLSPEQQKELQDILEGKTDMDDIINEQFYHYKRPDYHKLGTREITWLGPFFNAEHDDNRVSLCGWVKDDSEKLPLEQKRNDLRKYLYTLFDSFNKDKDDDADEWKLYGPLWMIEHLKLNDCLDVVLEVLRQDAHFFTIFVALYEPYMTAVLRQLGSGQIDVLKDFLYEQGLVPSAKQPVFDALVSLALNDPTQRLAAVSVVSSYLNHCYDICSQGANPANIDHYAHTLATAHIHELLPLLEKFYRNLEIPNIELKNGIKTVKGIMNDDDIPFRYDHDSLNDYLMDLYGDPATRPYAEMPYGHFFTDEEMKKLDKEAEKKREDFGGDMGDTKAFDNDYYENQFSICLDYEEPQKCYTIRVSLEDTSQPVYRAFTVPSNIYLNALAELIMTAFGRKDVPGYHFECQKEYYTNEDSNPVIDLDHDAEVITLQKLLKKKGQHIGFTTLGGSIRKPFFWEHDIVLEKVSKYSDNDEFLIDLEAAGGIYPTKACKDMTDYEKKLKKGKMRKINDITIVDKLYNWECENL